MVIKKNKDKLFKKSSNELQKTNCYKNLKTSKTFQINYKTLSKKWIFFSKTSQTF